MSGGAVVLAIAVLLAVTGLSRLLRRLVFGFAVAAAVLLVLHSRHAPGEAMAGLGALAAGLMAMKPVRRLATAVGMGG
jgi:hypothetical protein